MSIHSFYPVFDNTLDDLAPDTCHYQDALGMADNFGVSFYPFLVFDFSTVPPAATITSATLHIYTAGTPGGGQEIKVYRVLPANNSATVNSTWNYADGSTIRWTGDTDNNGGANAGCSVSGVDFSTTQLGSIASWSQVIGHDNVAALDLTEFLVLKGSFQAIVMRRQGGNTQEDQGWSLYYANNYTPPHPEYRPRIDLDYTGGALPSFKALKGVGI